MNDKENVYTMEYDSATKKEKKILIFVTTYSFPGGSDGKASACNAGDLGSIRGSGRHPGEGNGNPLQYSCLENPMNGVTRSLTQLNDFTFFSFLVTTYMDLRTRAIIEISQTEKDKCCMISLMLEILKNKQMNSQRAD